MAGPATDWSSTTPGWPRIDLDGHCTVSDNAVASTGMRTFLQPMRRAAGGLVFLGVLAFAHVFHAQGTSSFQYRELELASTATLQEEMEEWGRQGFRFNGVMTVSRFKQSRRVAIMIRDGSLTRVSYGYQLLETSDKATTEKALQAAGDSGFEYRSGLAFNRPSGGREEVLIVEQNRKAPPAHYEYRLVAIGEMATLQKELQAAGDAGFRWRETLYATTRRRPSVLILRAQAGCAEGAIRIPGQADTGRADDARIEC